MIRLWQQYRHWKSAYLHSLSICIPCCNYLSQYMTPWCWCVTGSTAVLVMWLISHFNFLFFFYCCCEICWASFKRCFGKFNWRSAQWPQAHCRYSLGRLAGAGYQLTLNKVCEPWQASGTVLNPCMGAYHFFLNVPRFIGCWRSLDDSIVM